MNRARGVDCLRKLFIAFICSPFSNRFPGESGNDDMMGGQMSDAEEMTESNADLPPPESGYKEAATVLVGAVL